MSLEPVLENISLVVSSLSPSNSSWKGSTKSISILTLFFFIQLLGLNGHLGAIVTSIGAVAITPTLNIGGQGKDYLYYSFTTPLN